MVRPALTRSERARSLDGLYSAANAAAAVAGGYEERWYQINGHPLCLRFAGPSAIVRMARALLHLTTTPTADPSLTIHIWDSRSSGLPEPEGPWKRLGERRRGAIRGLLPNGQGFFQWYDESLAVLNVGCQEGYYWVQEAGCDPTPAPLSPIFGSWLAQHGMELVHGGAVGTERGCVMFVGAAGSGKSHTALACLQDGLGYLGDDACVVDTRDAPTAYSIYSTAWVLPFTLRRLPALWPMVSNPDRGGEEKALLLVGEHAPDSLLREAPIRAIAVTSFSGHENTYVRPASPGDALVALAPSSLLQQPGAGQRMLWRLARIARGVECVHLEAGRDPSRLARAVRALL